MCWEDGEHVSRDSIGLLGKDRVLRGTDISASLGAPDCSLECTGDTTFMLQCPVEAASTLGGDLQIPYSGLNQIFPPKSPTFGYLVHAFCFPSSASLLSVSQTYPRL